MGKTKNVNILIRGSQILINTLFSIQFNKANKIMSQNIFIEAQRWNRYAHPLEELKSLKTSGSSQLIKNYFLNKNLRASILRHISSAQLQKSQGSLKCQKVKQIYKERMKKWTRARRIQDDNGSLEAKFSDKTLDDQDQEISQYLNFWEQEEHLLLKK